MTNIPQQIDDVRYCVLDYSNSADVDFWFPPLIFIDEYTRPSADLQIGPFRVQIPMDWSIVIADKDLGNLEIIELKKLNDREFEAFVLNPINGYAPRFLDISIQNTFPDVAWSTPKLKRGHILAVPLNDDPQPLCAYFVKETNKLPEVLDISKVFA
jgi:hypothetical protein